jgi:hypothetical protein
MTYKILLDPFTKKPFDNQIFRIKDSACIPFDPANTDYQQYLKWLEAGNKPLPADK